jgi:1-acyl-sn-glycerol-3-phosphate acyltransferase
MKYVFNFFWWIFCIADAVVLMVINLAVFALTVPFDPKRKVIHALSYYWGLHYLWFNPLWKLEYRCLAQIDPGRSYVIAGNHQSMLDICVMYKVPLVFKWISKREVFNIPFVGWLLKLHGDILISRGDTQSTKKMLREAAEWIGKGCSICIFPEGTRSPDGEIGEFKEGAFLIAKMNRLPVLPVRIEGTRRILPPGSGLFGGRARCRITVLPEISAETVASVKVRELSDMVRSRIKG